MYVIMNYIIRCFKNKTQNFSIWKPVLNNFKRHWERLVMTLKTIFLFFKLSWRLFICCTKWKITHGLLNFHYTVEHVYSDTPRDQGNMSDCTGCWKTQVFFLVNRNVHKINKRRNCVYLIWFDLIWWWRMV